MTGPAEVMCETLNCAAGPVGITTGGAALPGVAGTGLEVPGTGVFGWEPELQLLSTTMADSTQIAAIARGGLELKPTWTPSVVPPWMVAWPRRICGRY
jgi:hypothetical protein